MQTLTATTLLQVELFKELSEEQRTELAPYFEICEFQKAQYLFHQGDARTHLFVVLEGELDLLDMSLGVEKIYVTVGPGTVLGEPLLVDADRYSLSGRTVTNGYYARLSANQIEKIKADNLALYANMVVASSKLMARRMANASRGDRGYGELFRSGQTRMEHDLLGEKDVPRQALWGIHTLRAIENFNISGIRLDHFPEFVEALVTIKRACAVVNADLGLLDKEISNAIVSACDEIQRGLWHGHFVVDMIQGGAGTSTNMNSNEVIANRALEILGRERGEYEYVHPNNHVNMSQSTNDVYPSAIKIALLTMIGEFMVAAEMLEKAFDVKAEEFAGVIKMGRTQLQDAVPMTLGQEFKVWSRTIAESAERIQLALNNLHELNMGGTAIGTGINTHSQYAPQVIHELNNLTGLDLHLAHDLVEATQDTSSFVELSGVIKMFAVRLSKICNDLRLLSSGPGCGFNEINLPPVQAGSSIMPGKVNPVIPEVVNQVAFQVMALDNAVAMASEAGQLQLNVFEPLIAYNLFTSISMMTSAINTLRTHCVVNITANEKVCRDMVLNSVGVVTALNPYLGYEKSSFIAREALKTKKSVFELVLEYGYLDKESLEDILSPENMIRPK
ncbi:MAG: aspartate ammonia-lyase [Gammaproteobacteria bacterium]|nr:aspartate ammonia-lyase [Gammaproteobacteria bacterium]